MSLYRILSWFPSPHSRDIFPADKHIREPFMDLPPSNSFCRMLTHKLADYYHMTHSFEAVVGAVRIYRTPFCRVPPPLSSFAAASTSNSSTPPPTLLPKKIMRRGEDGELAPTSAGPSKPTSEVGSDVKDRLAPTKEKYVHCCSPSLVDNPYRGDRLLTLVT